VKLLRRPETTTAALVILALIGGFIWSPNFLNAPYLLDKTTLLIETGLAALGMTFVIVAGEIDLSVGSTLGLCACLFAKLLDQGLAWPLATLATLAAGCVLGLINGSLIAKLHLPSFVVTLATYAGYRGAAQALMKAESVKIPPALGGIDTIHIPGTPIPVELVALILIAIAASLILSRTVFGRWIYATGSGLQSAIYSGVPAYRVKAIVFVISGFMAALGAIVMDSRLKMAEFDHGTGMEIQAITAVVLGGASIFGGQGTILGTMLALLVLSLLQSAMGLSDVSAEYQLAIVGSLLILSIIATNWLHRLSVRRERRILSQPVTIPGSSV